MKPDGASEPNTSSVGTQSKLKSPSLQNVTVQTKQQTYSRIFTGFRSSEKRSRSVAPAGSITDMATHHRRKANEDSSRLHLVGQMYMRKHHSLRIFVGEIIQKIATEAIFASIVILYGVFVVIQLTMTDGDLHKYRIYIDICDISVGSILLFEILLKVLVFRFAYLTNFWTIFDAIVIVTSLVLGIFAATGLKSIVILKILRLRVVLRILRVFVVIERVKKRSIRAMRRLRKSGPISSPVERVLCTLYELHYHPALTNKLRFDIDFAIDVIRNNRLYEVIDDLFTDDVDDDTQNWLRAELSQPKDHNRLFTKRTDGRGGSVLLKGEDVHAGEVANTSIPARTQQTTGRRSILLQPFASVDVTAEIELKALYKGIANWDFDIFAVEERANGNVMSRVGYQLLQCLASETLRISSSVLLNFLMGIQSGYISTNPYHNAIHATDVMQTVNYFFCQSQIGAFFRPLDHCLALISAAIHDFRHDGYNNSFHISTGSEIAIRYNDNAVLENYHVAQSFFIMKDKDCNILGNLPPEEFKCSRELIIQMVLATDMSRHFEDVALFKTNILPDNSEAPFAIKNLNDKKLLMKMILHTSDVSNPAKPRETMLRWTHRVVEEFFIQGDMEKQLQLPVSPFMDRDTMIIKNMQVGFADFIVIPLFTIWAQIVPKVESGPCKMLQGNREFWTSLSEDFKPCMILDVLRDMQDQKKGYGKQKKSLVQELGSHNIQKVPLPVETSNISTHDI